MVIENQHDIDIFNQHKYKLVTRTLLYNDNAIYTEKMDRCQIQDGKVHDSRDFYLIHLNNVFLCVALVFPIIYRCQRWIFQFCIISGSSLNIIWWSINRDIFDNQKKLTISSNYSKTDLYNDSLLVGINYLYIKLNSHNAIKNLSDENFATHSVKLITSINVTNHLQKMDTYNDIDFLLWNITFLIINFVHLCFLINSNYINCRLDPVRILFYDKYFKPLNISKYEFSGFLKASVISAYSFNHPNESSANFKNIKVNDKISKTVAINIIHPKKSGIHYQKYVSHIKSVYPYLSLSGFEKRIVFATKTLNKNKFKFDPFKLHYLLEGSIRVEIGKIHIHDIPPMNFINSLEWDFMIHSSLKTKSNDHLLINQVSYKPLSDDIIYLSWDKEFLFHYFLSNDTLETQNKNPFLIKCILSMDILKKLFDVRETVVKDSPKSLNDEKQLHKIDIKGKSCEAQKIIKKSALSTRTPLIVIKKSDKNFFNKIKYEPNPVSSDTYFISTGTKHALQRLQY
ncbi:unnamed protein product [Gordionus sp. m RMFG-2023]